MNHRVSRVYGPIGALLLAVPLLVACGPAAFRPSVEARPFYERYSGVYGGIIENRRAIASALKATVKNRLSPGSVKRLLAIPSVDRATRMCRKFVAACATLESEMLVHFLKVNNQAMDAISDRNLSKARRIMRSNRRFKQRILVLRVVWRLTAIRYRKDPEFKAKLVRAVARRRAMLRSLKKKTILRR